MMDDLVVQRTDGLSVVAFTVPPATATTTSTSRALCFFIVILPMAEQRPNPLSIGVCVLIALHSDPNSPLQDLEVPSSRRRHRRSIGTLLEEHVLAVSSTTRVEETSLTRFIQNVRRHVGRDVADLLMETLERASESVDALMDLFDSLSASVQEAGLVDPTSAYGMYLRNCRLGFDALSFESVTMLWRALRERVQEVVANMNEDDDDHGLGSGNHSSNPEWVWPLSTEQLQDILRQECLEFEYQQGETKNDRQPKKRRARQSFEEMEVYIRRMLEKDPALPAAYFLRYLNCLRHNERVGALDALHQYFDHALVQQSGNPSAVTTDILQFSAILLAMTHSKFGEGELALMATEEAVRVAQQSKDAACVAFALGWLFEHHGQGTAERRELLYRCASRAAEQQLRPLASGAHLSLARYAMDASNAGGIAHQNEDEDGYTAWQAAWTHLQEVTAEAATDHQRVFDRPMHLFENRKDTMRFKCLQELVAAGIWDEIGMPEMSQASTMSALENPDSLSHDDLVTAIQNISRLEVYGTFVGNKHRRSGKNDNACKPSCAYGRSIDAVLKLRKELGLEGEALEGLLFQSVALTLHEWAVNRDDLDDARALQVVLDSALHPGLANYDQFRFDILMQKMHYLSATKYFDDAKTIARKFSKECKTRGPRSNQLRVLLQWAYMVLESDPEQCTAALTPLLEALAVADELKMHGLHAAAMSILARVFLRLQNPERSISILTGVIPTLTQKEHIRFQAEAYLTLTAAHLKLATQEIRETRGKSEGDKKIMKVTASLKQRYHKALESLGKALELFEEAQDLYKLRQGFRIQAFIYNGLGDFDKREESATKCIHLKKVPSNLKGTILDALHSYEELQKLVDRQFSY
jgi:tetratricopeptide (TPR) repeat protein